MLTIRRAEMGDHGTIVALWIELREFHRAIETVAPARWNGPPETTIPSLVDAAWTDPTRQAIFLAEEQGKPVGFVQAQLKGDGHCPAKIDTLLVAEGARGAGVGRALIDAALEWCQANGAAEVSLDCLWANERARGFYEYQGFRPLLVTYMVRLDPRQRAE
jgi:GNAT superfamily N-acetyltransferase